MEMNKTQYQGPDRQFGLFLCKRCNKSWESGNTWANTGQKCKKCNDMVYPYEQRPLDKTDSTDASKAPHPENLCGKCIKLGYACTMI